MTEVTVCIPAAVLKVRRVSKAKTIMLMEIIFLIGQGQHRLGNEELMKSFPLSNLLQRLFAQILSGLGCV